MSVERTQTLQFVVETTATGNGLRMTADQMKDLEQRIDALNAKAGKSPADQLQLGHMKNALFFAQQAGVADEAKELGRKVGEHAGEEAGEHLKKHIMRHLANIGGQAFGVGGAGGLFAAGGVAGVGAAFGINAIEKAIEAVTEKLAEMREEFAATGELVERMRGAQVFSEENLHRLTETAEHMHTAKNSATEWLHVLGDLTKAGADPKTVGVLSKDVDNLAKIMGVKVPEAGKLMASALEGDFEALKQVGIVVDDTQQHEQQMAFVTQQLALRVSEFGNAAVNAGPQVLALKKAAKEVADGLEVMKGAADDAQEAMTKLLALSEAGKGDKIKQINADEAKAIQDVETALAEHRIKTRQEADAKIQTIQKNAATARIAAEKENFETQKGAQQKAFEDAGQMMESRAGAIEEQKRKLAAIDMSEEAKGRVAKARDELQDAISEFEQSESVPVREEALERRKKLEKEISEEFEAVAGVRAAEQQKLNEMRKNAAALDEADVKRMLAAQEAIAELERKFKVATELTTTEAGTKDSAVRQRSAEAEEQRKKQLESEAKNYEKRRMEAHDKGLPEPDVPADLKGKSWTYDQWNDRVHFNSDAAPKMKGAAAAAAPALSPWEQYEKDVDEIVTREQQIAKSPGGVTEKWKELFAEKLRQAEKRFQDAEAAAAAAEERRIKNAGNTNVRSRPEGGARQGVDGAGALRDGTLALGVIGQAAIEFRDVAKALASRLRNDGSRT